MGNWRVTISGAGPHHNEKGYDIEVQAREFINKLKTHYQIVNSATLEIGYVDVTGEFIANSIEDLTEEPFNEKDAIEISSNVRQGEDGITESKG